MSRTLVRKMGIVAILLIAGLGGLLHPLRPARAREGKQEAARPIPVDWVKSLAWRSIDRGVSWTKINNTLPTVAVLDIALHPTAGELVAATHGRGLWVLDGALLRQTTLCLSP